MTQEKLRILKYPEEEAALRAASAPVTKEEISMPDFKARLAELEELLRVSNDGIAISAGQTNWKKQVIIIRENHEQFPFFKANKICFNPKIVFKTGENKKPEGCLSFKNLYISITRPFQIMVEYKDKNFETHFEEIYDYDSHIWSHEIDHNNGVLFIDHMPNAEKHKFRDWMNYEECKNIVKEVFSKNEG